MRSDNSLTSRQVTALAWTALISPVFRQLPHAVAAEAGRGAWVSVLLSALPLLLLGLLLRGLLRRLQPGEGLGSLPGRCLGVPCGRLVRFIFALWLLLYAGFVLRAGAQRFSEAVFPGSSPGLFIVVTVLVSLPAALGAARPLGRCAELIRPAVLSVLLLCFAFALPQVEGDNLLPVFASDRSGILRGVLPVTETLSLAAVVCFLPGASPGRSAWSSAALMLLLAALLTLTTVGQFGAALTVRISYPFFVMMRSVRLLGLLERVEALIIVQWVLTDFVLLGLLLQAARGELLGAFSAGTARRWGAAAAAAAAGIAFLLGAESSDAAVLQFRVMPSVNASMLLGLLPLCCVIGRLRRKL